MSFKSDNDNGQDVNEKINEDNISLNEDNNESDSGAPPNENNSMDEFSEDNIDTFLAEEYDDSEALKQKTKVRKIIIICLSVILIAGISIFGYMQYEKYSLTYALTFDGNKVSIEDYKLYLLFAGDSETAKDDAMTSLIQYLAIEKAVKEYNVVLTDEEKAEISTYVDSVKQQIEMYGLTMPNLTDSRFNEILSVNSYFTYLMEILSADYVVDEADYEAEFEYYRDFEKADYIDVELKYILTETKEEAEEALAKINDGADFDEITIEYSLDYFEDYGIETFHLYDFSLPTDISNIVLALSANDITNVVELNGYFVIFMAVDVYVPTDEELEESFRELYLQNVKYNIFDEALTDWISTANYKVNQKAIDAIQ